MTSYKTCPNHECSESGKPFTSDWCWKCKSRLGPYNGPAPQLTQQARATASEMDKRAQEIRAQREEWSRRTGIPLQDKPAAPSGQAWRSSDGAGAVPDQSSYARNTDTPWVFISTAGIGIVLLILGIIDKVSWQPKAAFCELGAQFGATGGGCTLPRLLGPFANVFLILGSICVAGVILGLWLRKKN